MKVFGLLLVFFCPLFLTEAAGVEPISVQFTVETAVSNLTPQPDEDGPAEIAEQLFAAMREKNADKIAALFITPGQLVAVDRPRSGTGVSKTRIFTGAGFAKAIAEGKGDFIEKMPEKDVKIDGDLAMVTGRYTFYVGETFSHCGRNSFHLVKTDSGWKIANIVSTLEFQCEK